ARPPIIGAGRRRAKVCGDPSNCALFRKPDSRHLARLVLATALVILPDFALMLLGLLLAHRLGFDGTFWTGAEKLVYYVLFPPLLFNAIVHSEFSIVGEAKVLITTLCAFGLTAAVGFLASPLLRPPGDVFASCVQTAFRYNSYIGL